MPQGRMQKSEGIKKKPTVIANDGFLIWCRLPESNWPPDDYKSTALPNELSRRNFFRFCFVAVAFPKTKIIGYFIIFSEGFSDFFSDFFISSVET